MSILFPCLRSGIFGERLPLRYYLSGGMVLSGLFTALFGFGYFWNIHVLWYFIIVQVGGCPNSGFHRRGLIPVFFWWLSGMAQFPSGRTPGISAPRKKPGHARCGRRNHRGAPVWPSSRFGNSPCSHGNDTNGSGIERGKKKQPY